MAQLTDREITRLLNRPQIGLNASWCVSAWQLTDGFANGVDGAHFILDNENGGLELVRRFFRNDGGNDEIEVVQVEEYSAEGLGALVALFERRCSVCGGIRQGNTCC